MNKQQTVTINGVHYDTHTGMRLAQAENQPTPATRHARPTAHALHKKTERTKTLSRKHVKAPAHKAKVAKPAATPKAAPVTRSPQITKFAPHSAPSQPPAAKPRAMDIAPVKHPLQAAVAHKTAVKSHPHQVEHKPAHQIKHQAISEAMEKAAPAKRHKQSFRERHPRLLSVASASLALVLLAGYLTYINLPSLSVKVAAVQAGIAATYPSYQPSGYSLEGPVAFSDGQVSMKFGANAGPQSFTVTQVKSSWNSLALLDNYVEEVSDGDYTVYTDSGLTVYVYDNDAAWVNGGILHTIEGDASLTNDQIRHIATSM